MATKFSYRFRKILKKLLTHTSKMMYTLIMANDWHVYYYPKDNDTMPVKDYIDSLSLRERAKTMAFISLLEDKGPNLPRPYADILDDGIHELRIKLTGKQVRILYFFCFKDIIVLTNAFEKHTNAVPESEIKSAKESRADFLARFKETDIRSNDEKLQRPS
jgi:phage-related protein